VGPQGAADAQDALGCVSSLVDVGSDGRPHRHTWKVEAVEITLTGLLVIILLVAMIVYFVRRA
jgi:hypothetical protein